MHPEYELKRRYFSTGATRPCAFRAGQLRALREALRKHERPLLDALAADLGKPYVEAFASEIGVVRAELAHLLDGLGEWMRPVRRPTPFMLWPARSQVTVEPLGVVLIIAPWNYPVQLSLLPLAGAIAAGNCAILKPSEEAPAVTAAIERLIAETFPPDFVSVVQGEGAQVVPALLRGQRFDHVFFTGSTAVGKKIMAMAAETLTPATLELGGKSPAIVLDDANLPLAARRIAWGKCYNAGQSCVAPDYALVPAPQAEAFIQHAKAAIVSFYGEHPLRSPDLGCIVNQRRLTKLAGYLGQGRVRHGGRMHTGERRLEPTILDQVDWSSDVMREEIFGPILPVMTYRHPDEIPALIQRNPQPLAAYLFGRPRDLLAQLQFGGGCVNDTLIHFANGHVPFGGVGLSGMGRYHGRESFVLFSQRRSVLTAPAAFDLPYRYPPYNRLKAHLFRLLFA